MENSLDFANMVLGSQPFSVLLDAEITAFDGRCVELRLPISSRITQQHGLVHGGVLSYAADSALTFAGGTRLGPAVVTSEVKINYFRPAKGDELVARASVIHAGRNMAVCQCHIFAVSAGELVLCAAAQGTISALSYVR